MDILDEQDGNSLNPRPDQGSLEGHSEQPIDVPEPAFQSSWTRRAVVASFWVIVLIGLPVWWKTTTIERLSLPKGEVESFRISKPCIVSVPVSISLHAERTIPSTHLETLGGALAQYTQGSCLDVRIGEGQEGGGSSLSYPVSFGDSNPSSPTTDRVSGRGHISLSATVGTLPASAQRIASELAVLLDARRGEPRDTRAVKYSQRYKLVFSLMIEDSSSGGSTSWNVEQALRVHIDPILDQLSPLHNFTVETQIQYFSPLTFEPVEENATRVVEEDQLKAFVNSAEWNLASAVSMDAVLHFVLYLPDPTKGPLRIKEGNGFLSESNAFIIPQWGGIRILDQTSEDPTLVLLSPQIPTSELHQAFRIFSYQLSVLTGIPSIQEAQLAVLGDTEAWRVDALIRRRILENTAEAVDTLDAIVTLVEDIQNMRVGEEVRDDVRKALDALRQTRVVMEGASPSLEAALNHSASALSLSSRAFFHPSMLALLYFPDEHKYAVYTPLFGPMAVPLIIAAISEFKEWRKQRKARLEKEKEE